VTSGPDFNAQSDLLDVGADMRERFDGYSVFWSMLIVLIKT
jgi:hypothetical protein